MRLSPLQKNMIRGFTLLELLVCIAIFAFMTAFLVAKYGNFNQGVLLTNLAYDTALTIRSAQSYGLNVQGQATSSTALGFNYAYGVHFAQGNTTSFSMFVDLCGDGYYKPVSVGCSTGNFTHGEETLSTYTVRSGFSISALCAGTSLTCAPVNQNGTALDIIFKRPNPDAVIINTAAATIATPQQYGKITIKASDGTTKNVVVQSSGQVEITN